MLPELSRPNPLFSFYESYKSIDHAPGAPYTVPLHFCIESLLKTNEKYSWSFLGQFLQASSLNPYEKQMIPCSHWDYSLTFLHEALTKN